MAQNDKREYAEGIPPDAGDTVAARRSERVFARGGRYPPYFSAILFMNASEARASPSSALEFASMLMRPW